MPLVSHPVAQGAQREAPETHISHLEEDSMMLRQCAIQGEARKGSQAFELKTHGYEVGLAKQVRRPSLNRKTPLAGNPLRSQGRETLPRF